MAEGWPQTSVDSLFQWQYRSIFVGGNWNLLISYSRWL